jgi:hypothetical protein
MAVTSITRIQHRRGVKADLPVQLAEGELGWCVDSRELFIGNSNGFGGNTGILTEFGPNDQLIQTRWASALEEPIYSVTRTLRAKLNDIASVKDFGALGDGKTDDGPAINRAIVSLLGNNTLGSDKDVAKRIALHLPAGIYILKSPILLYPYVTLVGDGIGKTLIVSASGMIDSMMQTCDSLGQTDANIGGNGAVNPPMNIIVSGTSFFGNGEQNYMIDLARYNQVLFSDCQFTGTWNNGEGLTTIQTGIRLRSIGNAMLSEYVRFSGCKFSHLSYAAELGDPVENTMFSQCKFANLYQALNIGLPAAYDGPKFTTVIQSVFMEIDDSAIAVHSPNPGIGSFANSYVRCGVTNGVHAITWHSGTAYNSSQGDVFDVVPGILDQGHGNLIVDAQQNNIGGGSGGTTGQVQVPIAV